jgi:hypothetical protein
MTDEKKKKTKEKKEKSAPEKVEAKPATEAKTETPVEAKSYSRGEGQKAVTQAYKDNWNTIFGKKRR